MMEYVMGAAQGMNLMLVAGGAAVYLVFTMFGEESE